MRSKDLESVMKMFKMKLLWCLVGISILQAEVTVSITSPDTGELRMEWENSSAFPQYLGVIRKTALSVLERRGRSDRTTKN